jgi:hypothetical protein
MSMKFTHNITSFENGKNYLKCLQCLNVRAIIVLFVQLLLLLLYYSCLLFGFA